MPCIDRPCRVWLLRPVLCKALRRTACTEGSGADDSMRSDQVMRLFAVAYALQGAAQGDLHREKWRGKCDEIRSCHKAGCCGLCFAVCCAVPPAQKEVEWRMQLNLI